MSGVPVFAARAEPPVGAPPAGPLADGGRALLSTRPENGPVLGEASTGAALVGEPVTSGAARSAALEAAGRSCDVCMAGRALVRNGVVQSCAACALDEFVRREVDALDEIAARGVAPVP